MIFSRTCDWPKTAQRRDRSLVQINRITIHLKTNMDFHQNTPKTSCLSWLKLNLAFPTCHRHHPGPHSHSSRLLHGCAVRVCSCIRSSTRPPPPPPAPSWLASSLQRALQPVRGFKKGNEFKQSEKLQMIKGKGNILSENTFKSPLC